jgi:hypothetical protein
MRRTQQIPVWFLAAVVTALAGCNANTGEQAVARLDTQATAEIAATVSTQVEGKLDAALVQIDKRIEDHSARVTEATQKAVVAVSKVDNSTNDKVVTRVLAIGMTIETTLLILCACFANPEGYCRQTVRRIRKRFHRGTAHHSHLQDQGSVLRS